MPLECTNPVFQGRSSAFLLALCPEIIPKGAQEIIGEAGGQTEFHYVQGKQLISCNISPKPTPLVFNCLIVGSIFFYKDLMRLLTYTTIFILLL